MKKMRFKKTVLAVAMAMAMSGLCFVPVASADELEKRRGNALFLLLSSKKSPHDPLLNGIESFIALPSDKRAIYIAGLKEIADVATSDRLAFKQLPNGNSVGVYGYRLKALGIVLDLANKAHSYNETFEKLNKAFHGEGDYEEIIMNGLTGLSELGIHASDLLIDKAIDKIPIVKNHPVIKETAKYAKNLAYYYEADYIADQANGMIDSFNAWRDERDREKNNSAYTEIESLMKEFFDQHTKLEERYLGDDIINKHLSKEVMAKYGSALKHDHPFQYFDESISAVMNNFEARRAHMLERLEYHRKMNVSTSYFFEDGVHSEKLDDAITRAITIVKSMTRENQSRFVEKLEAISKERINAAVQERRSEKLQAVLHVMEQILSSPDYSHLSESIEDHLSEFIEEFLHDLLTKDVGDEKSYLYNAFVEKLDILLVEENNLLKDKDTADTEDSVELAEREDKKHKKEKEIADLIEKSKDDVRTDETRTLEKNFYERALARTDVDILFLADNTGSMSSVIRNVREHAQDILDGLRADLKGDSRFATGSKKVDARFGVGRYLGDPKEGVAADKAYELIVDDADKNGMSTNDETIKGRINKWFARGGGDWQEGNFYAIQQAIEEGAATPRTKGSGAELKSGHKIGWRKDAAKVIVIFGDAPSWQHSVNEKELKALLRANPEVKLVFIDTRGLNEGSTVISRYNAYNTAQIQDAAVELADASGGVYVNMQGISLDNLKEVIVDAVFDALADNTRTGGMLARMGTSSNQQWRVRTPSSVTVESADGGKTLNFALRYPNKPTSGFVVDTAAKTRVSGTGYYTGKITDFGYTYKDTDGKEKITEGIFGKDFSAGDSVFHTNADNSFLRFVLRDGTDNTVEGYYGERLSNKAKLPSSATKTISSYDMRHRVINPNSGRTSSAAGAMKLFVNWSSGDVYGIETNAQLSGGTGTALFIGKRAVDRDRTELTGNYLYKTRQASGSSLVIRDAARDTTTLQIYGKNGAEGLGGTFGTVFAGASSGLSSMMMSGFRNQASVANTDERVKNDTWTGYAAGWVRDGSDVKLAYSNNPNEVQIKLSPAGSSVQTNVNMRIDGTGASVGFANAASEPNGENLYITKDAFVAVKDIHGTPSYVAAAGEDGLDYLTWGVWSSEAAHSGLANATVIDGSHWIAGAMTPTVDMPKTGGATYNGQVHGTAYEGGAFHALNGTSKLEANFATGNIGGSLNINYANGGAYATSNLSSVSIHDGNRFGGSLGGANNVGNIQGAFYGPGAVEVGGNWSINKNGGASQATGIFTGKK